MHGVRKDLPEKSTVNAKANIQAVKSIHPLSGQPQNGCPLFLCQRILAGKFLTKPLASGVHKLFYNAIWCGILKSTDWNFTEVSK